MLASACAPGTRARAVDPAMLGTERLLAQLRAYLWTWRRDPELRRIQRSFLGSTPLSMFTDPAAYAVDTALGAQRFRHPAQRPDTLYIPFLDSIPFPGPDSVSAALEAQEAVISDEIDRVLADQVTSPSAGLAQGGSWSTFPLMRGGRPLEANIARCPRTWDIVRNLPILLGASGGAYFSILTPGTRIAPHFGPTNARWRYHLALRAAPGARIRVADEWREWTTGRCLILDDSFEHEVVHAGEEARIILLVDAWRPELTLAERRFIAGLYERLRTLQN